MNNEVIQKLGEKYKGLWTVIKEDDKPVCKKKTNEEFSFKDINENDILFVKGSYDSTENISDSHKRRPFIVTKKMDEDSLLEGFYTTSYLGSRVYSRPEVEKYKFVIKYLKYNLPDKKNSLVKINEKVILPFDDVIRKLDTLDDTDAQRLHKLISLKTDKKAVVKNLQVRDIFMDEAQNQYLIYNKTQTDVYGFNVLKVGKVGQVKADPKKSPYHFVSGARVYMARYEYSKKISNLEGSYVVSDVLSEPEIQKVLAKRKSIGPLK